MDSNREEDAALKEVTLQRYLSSNCVKRVCINVCRYNERLNTEIEGSKTPRTLKIRQGMQRRFFIINDWCRQKRKWLLIIRRVKRDESARIFWGVVGYVFFLTQGSHKRILASF
jgi:hypothetical protein